MGWDPRGRVLGLVQEKVWFMVGEENGVEDKAGEMREQQGEPQQGPPPCCTVGTRKPPNHRKRGDAFPDSPQPPAV